MPRILFATDLHGNTWSYEKLFSEAERLRAAAVVLGGDILTLPPRTQDLLEPQREFVLKWLGPRLRAFKACPVFGMMGNDDWAGLMPLLVDLEKEGALRLIHGCKREFVAGRSIIGYSCVPVTPFGMKDWDRLDQAGWKPDYEPPRCLFSGPEGIREGTYEEVRRRPTIAQELEPLVPDATTVVVTHTPPYRTLLDVMWDGRSIGSRAVRAWIEKHRPFLSLHGHVHESPQITGVITDRIGPTVMVNPGDSLSAFRAVAVDLEDPVKVTPLRGS